MTENEMIASVSEMEIVPVEEDNKAKYYTTNIYMRTCPVCGKVFHATPGWAYRKPGKWYCCYTHYVEGGGDGGMDRVRGEEKEVDEVQVMGCKYCTNGETNAFGEESFQRLDCENRTGIYHQQPYIFRTNGRYFLIVEKFTPIRIHACPICGRKLKEE